MAVYGPLSDESHLPEAPGLCRWTVRRLVGDLANSQWLSQAGVLTFLRKAVSEGVSRVAQRAQAVWHMSDHSALGPRATRARAGVAALLVDTCQAAGTITIDNALGAAGGWRAQVARQTGAGRRPAGPAGHRAQGVGAAGRRDTRVAGRGRLDNDRALGWRRETQTCSKRQTARGG